MTVLDWLKSINGFNLGETSLTVIANTRGISTPDVAEYSVLTAMQRELMSADLILNYVLFQPTTTGSISQSHKFQFLVVRLDAVQELLNQAKELFQFLVVRLDVEYRGRNRVEI